MAVPGRDGESTLTMHMPGPHSPREHQQQIMHRAGALAAVYLGIGRAACDAAAHYANNRVPPALGKPIATAPHVQQWIGEMDVTLRAARTVLHGDRDRAARRRRLQHEARSAAGTIFSGCARRIVPAAAGRSGARDDWPRRAGCGTNARTRVEHRSLGTTAADFSPKQPNRTQQPDGRRGVWTRYFRQERRRSRWARPSNNA